MEIDEFLTARYDEDEAVARAATQLPCCEPLGWRAADRWSHRPRGLFTRDDTGGRAITLLTPDYPESVDSGVDLIRAEDGGIPVNIADHIVTWDPARVLADIAAKRKIVAEYRDLCAHRLQYEEGAEGWAARTKLKWVCELFAQSFAAHPDFKPEWRIDG